MRRNIFGVQFYTVVPSVVRGMASRTSAHQRLASHFGYAPVVFFPAAPPQRAAPAARPATTHDDDRAAPARRRIFEAPRAFRQRRASGGSGARPRSVDDES